MKKYIIDRIAHETVYLETEEKTIVPVERPLLPADIEEGMVLSLEDTVWTIDREEQTKRQNQVRNKMDRLFARRGNQ